MDDFYTSIRDFIKNSSNSQDAIKEAISLHQNIDVFVKKLQILKEYTELLEDELLFFSKKKEIDSSVFSIELFNSIQTKLLNLEKDMYNDKFLDSDSYSLKLSEISALINKHIDKMYKIGEELRETDILKNNLGG